MTPQITLYTKHYCPYCKRAKALLDAKGATYTDIEISDTALLTAEMEVRSGRHTVPQIFIGEHHVGGASDLFDLEAAGRLDELLQIPEPA